MRFAQKDDLSNLKPGDLLTMGDGTEHLAVKGHCSTCSLYSKCPNFNEVTIRCGKHGMKFAEYVRGWKLLPIRHEREIRVGDVFEDHESFKCPKILKCIESEDCNICEYRGSTNSQCSRMRCCKTQRKDRKDTAFVPTEEASNTSRWKLERWVKFSLKTWFLGFFTEKKVWRITKFYGPDYGEDSELMGGTEATAMINEAMGYAEMWIDYEYNSPKRYYKYKK